MKNVERARQLREQNKTYQEIADELGISRQRVGIYLKSVNPRGYKVWTKDRCVYQGLREWLSVNKYSLRQFIIQLGYAYHLQTARRWRDLLNGTRCLNFDEIKMVMELTGKTFEELFIIESQHAKIETVDEELEMEGNVIEEKRR